MRLALVIDDYLPNSTRVGAKMFHELACEFLDQGHNVTVITAGESQRSTLREEKIDGVAIWRFSSGKIKDVSKVKRAINETALSIRAWRAIKDKVTPCQFDAVIYYSPSIFFGHLVKKIKQRCQCSTYLVLRDFFPQWALDAGMIRSGSLIEKYFRFFEKYSYRQADVIGLMSERSRDVFESANNDFRTRVLRNWAKIAPVNISNSYRGQLGLQGKVIYFYGGNIGHAQDMANLMRLAKGMQSYKNAHFLFVGQGDEVRLINNLANEWGLDNFTYLPSISQADFKKLLAQIDIGLFSLSNSHTTHNFPGKLLGYMVQSVPILGSVNNDNDLMPLVNKHGAGFIHINGEDKALLKSAIKLYEDVNLRESIGNASFELLKKEFDVSSIASSIVFELEDLK